MEISSTQNVRFWRGLALALLLLGFGPATAWAQYCFPSYQNACTSDDYINSVNFAGIVNTNTGCGNPGLTNYTNYTGAFTGNIVTSQPTMITVSPGPTWGQYFVAMIDVNHDNDFGDPGEFYDIGYSFGGGTVSNFITLPCDALTGITRLRILCQYSNSQLFQSDICNPALTFGEVEDYNINITHPSTTDANLSQFITPVTACGMSATEQVSVRIKNVGGQTINSYTACYRINNGAPVCQTVAVTILPCDSVTHVFSTPANLAVSGPYDFDAYVTVSGDVNHTNDTVSNYMVTNVPIVGSIPYVQNFDVTNGGFLGSGTSSSWAWGAPTSSFITHAASNPNAWVTNLNGPYNTDEFSFLTSPCFNLASLTADPYVSFSHIYELEQGVDFGYAEISTDAGATWSHLGNMGTGNNWYNNPGDVWDEVSGPSGVWRAADHQLTGTAGHSSVRFRFAIVSDAFGSLDGMGIDDVRLVDTLKNTGALTLLSPTSGCQMGPNESVTITLQNYGSHAISNIPVCYTIGGGPAVCEVVPGPIAPGATLNYTFVATANLSTIGGYNFVTYTNWSQDYTRANDTVRATVLNLPIVNSFPYRQSFEAGTGNWGSGGTAFNDWAWGTPAKSVINTAGAGTKCWVTAGLTPGDYVDNTNSWVESPCFDLSTLTNPWVALKAFWYSEFSWDGTVLESSTDGGVTWLQVGAFGDPGNWYNDNSIQGLINFGGSGEGWTDLGTGWGQTKHEITALAGQSAVRFRVHFSTDASVTFEGFAFDDFIIAEPPVVRLGNDTLICSSVLLDPQFTTGTFSWSGAATATTPTLTATAAGTYYLTYTDTLGLEGRDTIVLNASPTPPVDLGVDRTLCHGDTACFSVNASNYPNFQWSTGASTSTICVTTGGTWSIQATDAVGCTTRDSVVTTVIPTPSPFIGSDTTICQGSTLCFGSNCGPNHTYIWSTGATTQQICVNAAGSYWMKCINANGCEGADSVVVTQALSPLASGSANTSGCPMILFNNTSSGGITSYAWDFGDGQTSSSATPSHDYTTAGNGNYTVSLVATNGCGNDTLTFVVNINCLVSIGSVFENQLRLYPNPNSGQFRLETTLSGTAPVKVTIVDLNGKAVYAHDFGQMAGKFEEAIDLDVAKGVYFVKMDVGGQMQVRKLILQ